MLSDRLKEIQEYLDASNQELADRLFISVSLVEKMRAGIRRISPEIARELERIYHQARLYNGI